MIERLVALSTGVVEVVNGGWKYSVVLKPKNLELEIKVPELLEVEMGDVVAFYGVTGGPIGHNGSWFKAEKLELEV